MAGAFVTIESCNAIYFLINLKQREKNEFAMGVMLMVLRPTNFFQGTFYYIFQVTLKIKPSNMLDNQTPSDSSIGMLK